MFISKRKNTRVNNLKRNDIKFCEAKIVSMGIYIVKSKHVDWIKIGHHKVTKSRPSVYYRYINRGFYSCECPEKIQNKVSFDDLELLNWFHNLDIDAEEELHNFLSNQFTHTGEWYLYENLEEIRKVIVDNFGGLCRMPCVEEYNDAIRWAKCLGNAKTKVLAKLDRGPTVS